MMQYKPGNASVSTIHNPTLAAGVNHMKSSQLSCLSSLYPLHYSPSVLYQAQYYPWYHEPEYSDGCKSWCLERNPHGCLDCPLQWSKDEDDDQAQMMSSSQLIDVPLYWRRKNFILRYFYNTG